MAVAGQLYPVELLVGGRLCLVVGGGRVAARKAAGLLAGGAHLRVVAPELSRAMAELVASAAASAGPPVSARLPVDVRQRPYRSEDLDGVWLAMAATNDSALNETVRADGDRQRVWVNTADDPDHCSFILPAVARQGPLVVAVSTSGYSPALAVWLKEHVLSEMGPEWAILATMLNDARAALRAAGRSTESVDWRSVVGLDMIELIRVGDLDAARERLSSCLSLSLD